MRGCATDILCASRKRVANGWKDSEKEGVVGICKQSDSVSR